MMHIKFAARLAGLARDIKNAHGPVAVSEWWEYHFGHLPDSYFWQVMEQLKRAD